MHLRYFRVLSVFAIIKTPQPAKKQFFGNILKKTIFLALNSVREDNTWGIDDSLFSTLIVVGQLDLKNITIFRN